MQNTVTVHPVEHASLVLTWGDKIIYADPVGEPVLFDAYPRPNIIFVTHEHHDHFSPDTLMALLGADTILVTPPSVADKLPPELKQNLKIMKNGDTISLDGLNIQAILAYNLRPEAQQFHPKGRDNGYVLEAEGARVYIAGDTEDIPEMRTLKNIDIAFIPMNLPYTMSVESAASGVLEFKPKQVYPYHYRGPDGLSDVNKFKQLVNAGDPDINVVLAKWY